jgi:1,4-dihydroxy-6-naphthoate synthase
MQNFTLGFSPCPNDTFIFDALVNKKIDTQNFNFSVQLADVQTLNEWALQQKLMISKISYGVYPLVKQNYQLLQSGGALGKGVGPLLISKMPLNLKNLQAYKIAVPGKNTTANLLFSWAFPTAIKKQYMVFSEIENAVLNGTVDAGVIIHENRFTYAEKGLIKLTDLGSLWEENLKVPIPLGGIVVHNSLPTNTAENINSLIQESIAYAWKSYPILSDYITTNAQEMSEEVMRKHINLYVNSFSLHLGEDGQNAIDSLLQVHQSLQ